MISARWAAATTIAGALLVCGGALFAHDPVTTKVTWDREIGPLVQARCVSCHSPGGRAPMPLTTYQEARPWARAIREEVLTRRMPKWHVVRGYGDFRNDPSLSPFEIALFAAWADGGSPRSLPASTTASAGKPVTEQPAIDSRVAPTARPGGGTAGSEKPAARELDLPCTARTLPPGRLLGLKPVLREGADLRVTVTHPDGTQDPLLWLRGFDPEFVETYWLRRPVQVTGATRITLDGTAPCRVTVLLEAKTAR